MTKDQAKAVGIALRRVRKHVSPEVYAQLVEEIAIGLELGKGNWTVYFNAATFEEGR